MAVEDALSEAGQPWNKIVATSYLGIQVFYIWLPEHPEYLKDVLNQIFGYAEIVVVAKIKKT